MTFSYSSFFPKLYSEASYFTVRSWACLEMKGASSKESFFQTVNGDLNESIFTHFPVEFGTKAYPIVSQLRFGSLLWLKVNA